MVNGINCQNYQLLIGRKEMVVLRRAQSKTFPVILSLPRPVILSSSKDDHRRRLRVGDPVPLRQAQSKTQYVILSSSKDDLIDGLRICGTVPLRQAQSDSVVQSNSGAQSDRMVQSDSVAQSDTYSVILSSSKDDLRSKDDPKSKDKKGVLCRKNIAIAV